jgi:hypothetical protein
MQARLEGLRLGLGSSLLGVVATTAGSLHRYAVYLIFYCVRRAPLGVEYPTVINGVVGFSQSLLVLVV